MAGNHRGVQILPPAGGMTAGRDAPITHPVSPHMDDTVHVSKHEQRLLQTHVHGETSEEQHELLKQALLATSVDVRKLITRLRNEIDVISEEWYQANANDTQIPGVGAAQTNYSNNIIKVKTVMFQGPAASTTLTLTLGRRQFKFTNPTTGGYWENLNFILTPDEIRKMTWAPAAAGGGDVFLWIIGEQMAEVKF